MTQAPLSDDYGAAIQFLYSRINYEQTPPLRPRKLNLEHIRRLLRQLGDPHLEIPTLHIAGTKGKGSTASMISSVLTQAGYRTALYTSPHLEQLEERYVIDGQKCTRAELVSLTQSIRPYVEAVDREIQSVSPELALTFFEITTAMAFRHFVERQVDIAVLEVGMGGRLDSTNVCMPLVSIITSISFDHTKQLGNTLAAIAGEKAGIIKPGIPVVSGVEQPEPRQVILDIAKACNAPTYTIGDQFDLKVHGDVGHTNMSYREQTDSCQWTLDNVHVGLLGRHQARNAAVTLAALQRLREQDWTVDEGAIRRGLAQVQCPARIEVVQRDPLVIVDTAHNVASIQTLVDTLQEYFQSRRRILIFAASRDKDVQGMLRLLLPHFDEFHMTRFLNNPRAVSAEELANFALEILRVHPRPGRAPIIHMFEKPVDAWKYCRATLSKQELVCVTGSFFLAAELRSELLSGCKTLPVSSTDGV